MARNPYRTPEFLSLFREWNEILEQTGFKDVEDFSLKEPALKSWHGTKWQGAAQKREETIKYYDLAAEVFRNFQFKSQTHRRIWQLHIQGVSSRKIAELVNTKKFSKSVVHNLIMKIQRQSGIKK